jgi:hypothetical protein
MHISLYEIPSQSCRFPDTARQLPPPASIPAPKLDSGNSSITAKTSSRLMPQSIYFLVAFEDISYLFLEGELPTTSSLLHPPSSLLHLLQRIVINHVTLYMHASNRSKRGFFKELQNI